MSPKTKPEAAPGGKVRLRAEIVQAMQGLYRIGAVTDVDLSKTTLRMLGRDASLKDQRLGLGAYLGARNPTLGTAR